MRGCVKDVREQSPCFVPQSEQRIQSKLSSAPSAVGQKEVRSGSTLSLAIAREPGRIGWVTGRTYTIGMAAVYGWQASHDALGRPASTADSESAARTWTYNERSEMTG